MFFFHDLWLIKGNQILKYYGEYSIPILELYKIEFKNVGYLKLIFMNPIGVKF